MKNFLLIIFLMSSGIVGYSQAGYTANDQVSTYTGVFLPGINFDYYPPYNNEQLGNIAAGNAALGLSGIGAKTARPALRESFAEVWGYDHYVSTFAHFKSLGMKDMTMIVGFPAEWHQDQTDYCADTDPLHSFCINDPYTADCGNTMFANLYTPIWDGGANGTPYNDDNYLAAYMYKVVTLYKDDVKFWEIWNEPGFDHSYVQGWQEPGGPNNWWDNDPSPCVNHFKAPIEHFVRTLRICYDVVKTVDPDAYVTLAGVGFESFLDAVLRNTDNPVDGSVTPEYPLGGGAYFDVMGFHTYPDIDGSVREYDSNLGQWVFHRNSDAGANGVEKRKNTYANRLAMYGYDGVTYPKKEWIITEINVPRVKFGAQSMASDEVQVNYITKAIVKAMKLDIRQMHPYQLADRKKVVDAVGEFDLLGMYLNFNGTQPYDGLVKTNEGITYKTTSDVIYGTTYDAARTAAMNLPSNIDGGAFYDPATQKYKYILWAKTTLDLSEFASATYSFPASMGISTLYKRTWNYSETNSEEEVSGNNIALTGRPIYLIDGASVSNGTISLTCPENISVTLPAGQNSMVVNWNDATATTTCPSGGVSVGLFPSVGDFSPGDPLNAGTYTFEYGASDNCQNSAICSFTVTVLENTTGGGGDCGAVSGFTKLGEYNGHGYYLSTADWNWQDGRSFANTNGGYLATINNGVENDFIQSVINETVFIGLNDLNTEGTVEWENGEPVSYTNYNTTCSFCNTNDAENDFAAMLHWDGTWTFSNQWSNMKIVMEKGCVAGAGDVTISCPENLNVTIPEGATEVVVNYAIPTASTTCHLSSAMTIQKIAGVATGSSLSAGTYLVEYEATDGCLNVDQCSFTIVVTQGTATGSCDDIAGFTKLGEQNGVGYYLSNDAKSWAEANTMADNAGGRMAQITSATQNDFITNLITDIVFVGFTDMTTEGSVVWSDGTPVGYTNYSACDWCGLNTDENDFGVLLPWNGEWSFNNQWVRRPFVMQKRVVVAEMVTVVLMLRAIRSSENLEGTVIICPMILSIGIKH